MYYLSQIQNETDNLWASYEEKRIVWDAENKRHNNKHDIHLMHVYIIDQ